MTVAVAGRSGRMRSVKTKALVAITVLMAAITGISDQLELRVNAAERAAQLDTRAGLAVNIQADALSQPLWDLATDQVEVLLAALARDTDFLSAEVIGPNNKRLAAHGQLDAASGFVERRAEIAHVENGKRQPLGSLILRFSTAHLEEAYWHQLQASLLKTVLMLAIIMGPCKRRCVSLPRRCIA